jgi:hypothetical protein
MKEPLDTYIKIGLLQGARLGKDEIYRMVDECLLRQGHNVESMEMEIVPVDIINNEVLYNAVVSDYKELS